MSVSASPGHEKRNVQQSETSSDLSSNALHSQSASTGPYPHNLRGKPLDMVTYVKSPGATPAHVRNFLGLSHPVGPGGGLDDGIQDPVSLTRTVQPLFETQYFGPSYAPTTLLNCKDLSVFVRKVISRMPSSMAVRDSIEKSDLRLQNRKSMGTTSEAGQLASLMPPRWRAESLIQAYLLIFENTHRVLHVPTFLHQFEEFWLTSRGVSQSSIVHMLLAMSAVNVFVPGGEKGLLGRSSVERERSKAWVRAAEGWLDSQSHKSATMGMFQAYVLLFIAKKVNRFKIKRQWTAINTLTHLVMAAGLHRDPTHLAGNISPFDAEMRRRLWHTILELQLQEACNRGMRPTLVADDWDCLPPLNIHDEDLNPGATSMPPEGSVDKHTRTSFLCAMQKHYLVRVQVLGQVNHVKQKLTLEMARNYEDQLHDALDTIPRWREGPDSNVASVLIRLILYEHLQILWQPFITSDAPYHRSLPLQIAQRNAAITTMKLYTQASHPESLQLLNVRYDAFRAILVLCQDVMRSSNISKNLLHDTQAELTLVENTVSLFEERVQHLGQGFQPYWLSHATFVLIRSHYTGIANDNSLAAEAMEGALRVHEYLLTEQLTSSIVSRPEDDDVAVAEASYDASQEDFSFPDQTSFFDFFDDSIFDLGMTEAWSMYNPAVGM